MVGIISYGGYIPRYRLDRMTAYSAMGWLNPAALLPGERSIASYDEDSITMAVAAARDCLKGVDREKIDGLYIATTTAPYKQRESAGIIGTALSLRSDIRTADFTGSTRAGTEAVLAAGDAIKAGSAKNVLVCAADLRKELAGGYQEQLYGDGAAALLIGESDVIATIEGAYSVSYDFADSWRADRDEFERAWEDRWRRDEGYEKQLTESIAGLLQKYNLNIKDFARMVIACHFERAAAAIGGKLGANPAQIQDSMMRTMGDSGTSYPLAMLVAALEEAKPGDRLLVASYGNGSDALFLQATDRIEKVKDGRGIKKWLSRKKMLDNYAKYLAWREEIPMEKGFRGEEFATTQMSALWRGRKTFLGLWGNRCKKCGTPLFPAQRTCVNPDCGAIDEMEDYCFADKKASLFTYTADLLAYSVNPPAIYGVVDFEGGGRWWFDLTDCDQDEIKVGMPVEMSFRLKYTEHSRGIYSYFWKAIPAGEGD
jgi:3-hydroxy-3-methylglutaryl CoA synthase